MRFLRTARAVAWLSACLLVLLAAPAASGAAAPEGDAPPLPGHSPYAGPAGTATMHGDTGSSDATRLPGPGPGPLSAHREGLASSCPTVLVGSDGLPVALCTHILGRTPTVHLLDPDTGASTAELPLAKGSLLGGVYAYLDHRDRLVVVDGEHSLLRIAHRVDGDGHPELYVDRSLSLRNGIDEDDSVVGLSPDWKGRVWFATGAGRVGTVDEARGTVRTVAPGVGEAVANSISTSPKGTLVASDHALYLLRATRDGTPRVVWRREYDRGPGRKPGQLSAGTGSTPTFFGPRTGSEYTAIVDNAAPQERLLVHDAATGRLVCRVPVLDAQGSGSENSPIAAGNSVFVADTYGYPYPQLPEGAGPSVPRKAAFGGGMSRVDVEPDGSGCVRRWTVRVRSAAVPRLSLADGRIHTVLREPAIPGTHLTSALDPYYYATIDPGTGEVTRRHYLGSGFLYDTLQMAGTIAPGGVLYQGTITGVIRISAG